MVVDVGSTSASIIPVLSGKVAARGKTDLDKLVCGELVYTGSLRTNVAAIVQSVPIKGGVAGVASELFAQSADVHLVLGNITEEQYTCETADGRGKTMNEALARLARVVCADTEMLTPYEIVAVAKYIYDKQVMQVAEGLAKVYDYVKEQAAKEIPVVVTGLGKDFIARKAAEEIGAESIVDLATLMPIDVSIATPAFAVAIMTASKLEGDSLLDAVIVKVGGSLALQPEKLRALCAKLANLSQNHQLIVVPGGGEFADSVRALDSRFNLSPKASHRMALLAMNQYGLLLSDLLPNARLAEKLETIQETLDSGKLPIFLPASYLFSDDALEQHVGRDL